MRKNVLYLKSNDKTLLKNVWSIVRFIKKLIGHCIDRGKQ